MLQNYRIRIAKWLRPLGQISGVFLLVGVDAYRRYSVVAGEIVGRSVLDVGAGGKSFLSTSRGSCVSVDLRRVPGLDILASATHLPLRSNSIDCVVSVDTIEHIARPYRDTAIGEMKRVARIAVVIHVPVESGSTFAGRRYDIAFSEWHKTAKGGIDKNVEEHMANVEPSPRELEGLGFTLKGTHNANLWLSYMRLSYSFIWPLGLIMGHLYYLLKKRGDGVPPFWGAVGVYRKNSG